MAGEAEWFMDYWNADGSLAEMCGNGVAGLRALPASRPAWRPGRWSPIATRAGVVLARSSDSGDVVPVDLGRPRCTGELDRRAGLADPARGGGRLRQPAPGLRAVRRAAASGPGPSARPASTRPCSRTGSTSSSTSGPGRGADLHVAMRVYERGSAETLSCGSGALAVAAVALRDAGLADRHGGRRRARRPADGDLDGGGVLAGRAGGARGDGRDRRRRPDPPDSPRCRRARVGASLALEPFSLRSPQRLSRHRSRRSGPSREWIST